MDKNTQNIESFLVIYLFCVKIYVTGDKMTLEKQIYLLNLFKILINKYKDTALNIYLQNICDFINALEQSTLYSYEDFMLKIYTIINNYNAKFGFQNSWSGFVNALNSSAYSLQYKVSLASNVVWNWTKYKLSTASKAVQLAVTAAKADAAIRAKVRKNSKTRYWKATLSSTLEYVTLGNGITFSQAVNEVKAKRSVFCVFKSDARQVARRASKELYGIDGYYSDDPHCKSKRFAYNHYHVYKHKNGAHIWYLFD